MRSIEQAKENKKSIKDNNTTDMMALQAHQETGGTDQTFQELAEDVRRS